MPVRDLVILPDAQLRLISQPVVSADAALRQLVEDMFATMYDAPGIGLAAIQIGQADIHDQQVHLCGLRRRP